MNTKLQVIQKQQPKVGRKSVITEQIICILEDCFKKGLSDKTACQQAQIGRTVFYEKLNKDQAFANRMSSAKNVLAVKAAGVIANALDQGDVKTARWVLERKERGEFAQNPPNVLVNQNFVYQPPSWFISPRKIYETQLKTKTQNS